jgi:hypothetical protein
MALLRGAYTARVIGEEQLRMAASGLDSLINHPLSLIAMRLSEDSLLGRAATRLGGEVGVGARDALGGTFRYGNPQEFADGLDEYNKALNREYSFNGWADSGRKIPIWKKLQRGEDGFNEAWAEELGKLANDPVARETSRNLQHIDNVKEWFWGNGSRKLDQASTAGQRFRLVMGEEANGLLTRDVSDAYINSLVDRLHYTTGGDRDLLDMMSTGRLGEAPMRRGMGASQELRTFLEYSPEVAPEYLYTQLSLGERGDRAKQALDHATRWAFSNLMAERTNNLSRSPTFRQFYWQRAEELAPFMSDAAKTELENAARGAKMHDVADRIAGVTKSGDLELEAADHVAKGFALDHPTCSTIMTERSQMFDAYRLIFPFGDAWKPGAHPLGEDRHGASTSGPPCAAGHHRRSPERVLPHRHQRPGGVHLSGVGVGEQQDVRRAGPAQRPRRRPVVDDRRAARRRSRGAGSGRSVPSGQAGLRHAARHRVPLREPDTSHGVLETYLPAWVQKWRQTGTSPFARDEGAWNSTVLDVARYLSSTGKYDTSTADGMTHLIDVSKSKARYVYALRGAAQFFAPTAPTPEWLARDKNGHALVAQKLVEEYQGYLHDDPQHATDRMLEKYGDGIFLLLQGKTAEVTPAAPVTKAGADWERSHGDIAKRYPNVYGFFAPQGGDLDITAYGRQLDSSASGSDSPPSRRSGSRTIESGTRSIRTPSSRSATRRRSRSVTGCGSCARRSRRSTPASAITPASPRRSRPTRSCGILPTAVA